jgi:hypothetical protein
MEQSVVFFRVNQFSDKIFALLGSYAVYIDIYRRYGAIYRSNPQSSSLTLEDVTFRLSRNGYAVWNPKIAKFSFKQQWKPEVTQYSCLMYWKCAVSSSGPSRHMQFYIPSLLGAFDKISKRDYLVRHFRLCVCLSAWDNSAPTGRIFMKFDICFSKIC